MASIYTVAYRRKRKGLTDYKKRMKTLLGNKPRIVVRKSLKNFTIQIIEFKPTGDKIIASASTKELAKHGWKAEEQKSLFLLSLGKTFNNFIYKI